MKNALIATVLFALLLTSLTGFAASKHKVAATAPATDIPVQNASFELTRYPLTAGAWNLDVYGWQILPGTEAGIYHPDAAWLQTNAPIDGDNIFWMNHGGISQTLSTSLQAMADYTFSAEWYNRADDKATGMMVLKLVAGDETLATCAPNTTPADGKSAIVTLVYHSDGSSLSVGKPLTIQILYSAPGKNFYNQVTADDVHLTFTDRTGTPAGTFSKLQECSITLQQ